MEAREVGKQPIERLRDTTSAELRRPLSLRIVAFLELFLLFRFALWCLGTFFSIGSRLQVNK